MTQISVQFFTRRREDGKMGVLHAFAPSRLRVIPLSRHPREGGVHHLTGRFALERRCWIPAFAGMTKLGVEGLGPSCLRVFVRVKNDPNIPPTYRPDRGAVC